MAGTRDCDRAVINGRLAKALEFFNAAELLQDDMPTAAADLFIDSGIASSDVICCLRLGQHSSSGNHHEASALLKRADPGSDKHLNILLALKNKTSYTHQSLSVTECTKMNRAAAHLLDNARLIAASAGHGHQRPDSADTTPDSEDSGRS